MGIYFRSRRRKAGLVALAFACVSLAEWIRSPANFDSVVIRTGEREFRELASLPLSVGFITYHQPVDGDFPINTLIKVNAVPRRVQGGKLFENHQMRWQFDWGGIRIGENVSTMPNNGIEVVIIAYPYFVIPLTLISLWLLLSPPHHLTSTNANDHISGSIR